MRDLVSIAPIYGDYLAHHGIKGQKWGIRRYQNEDGTLTDDGRSRYFKNLRFSKADKDEPKVKTNKPKIIKGIAIAAGTVAAGALLAKFGPQLVSGIKKSAKTIAISAKGKNLVSKSMKNFSGKQMRDLDKLAWPSETRSHIQNPSYMAALGDDIKNREAYLSDNLSDLLKLFV